MFLLYGSLVGLALVMNADKMLPVEEKNPTEHRLLARTSPTAATLPDLQLISIIHPDCDASALSRSIL